MNINKTIKDYSYFENDEIEEIIIPEGITYIGERAFSKCHNLKKVTFPSTLERIGASAFSECENLEEIVLPKNLKKIDYRAFADCKKLKRVIIPEGVEEIDWAVFSNCTSLEEIVLPNSLKNLNKQLFLNCKNLKKVNLPENIDELPDEFFKGCNNLDIILNPKIKKLGIETFRDCYNLKIFPNNITSYKEKCFKNCKSLKEIDIKQDIVPTGCFMGCTNLKKITNTNRIKKLEPYSFSNCKQLEEIELLNIKNIPKKAFNNCLSLRKIVLNNNIQNIGIKAFKNCKNLSDFIMPSKVKKIKKEAFKNCKSLKILTIPATLDEIAYAAFANTSNIEEIIVSKDNKTFITKDNKILINSIQERLILYANGSKDKKYSLKDYNVTLDEDNDEIITPLTSIAEYAFADNKYLEELTISSCVKDIDYTSFKNSPQLKKLKIETIEFYTVVGFTLKNYNMIFSKENIKTKLDIPFEEITFTKNLIEIGPNALEGFENVKTITLPKDNKYNIRINAFNDCYQLKEVQIPNNIMSIGKNAFNENTELIFENGLKLKNLIELIHDNQYIGDYKLYVLKNDKYHIEQNNKITNLAKDTIDKICTHSEKIRDNPILFLDFMHDLIKNSLDIKLFCNGILMSNLLLENRKLLFENFKKEDEYKLNALNNSTILDNDDEETKSLLRENFTKVINYINIFKKYNIEEPILINKSIIANYDINKYESLLINDQELLTKIIKLSKLIEIKSQLTKYILINNCLNNYLKYIKKYNIKDQFIYSKPFISISNTPFFKDLLKVFDANIKRLIKASNIMDNENTVIDNFSDLLFLLKITGALEEDPIIRQKASTFITENMFLEKFDNNKINEYRIVGDDIHRVFNFKYIREEYDEEFANFFIENYKELIKEEREKSGFIQRVYLNFRQISKTSLSNKGSQRKLKVTIDKCKNYLLKTKFDNVTEENKKLADLIGAWYDDNTSWIYANAIYNESLKAPRNIFTKVEINDLGEAIYDNSKDNDLREEINENYSYEWLPKQDYNNLILGKYCNCCAHVNGAGQGIMRASMILDYCQNLVIRNSIGEIIAKSTLCLNKDDCYAVFNNVEVNLKYRAPHQKELIYKAFLRGVNAFFTTYNKNNKDKKLKTITIGSTRNILKEYFENNTETEIYEGINFKEYSIPGSDFKYNGDWQDCQRLVLKK